MDLYLKECGFDGCTVGIDIGSTTAKAVAIIDGNVVFERYERHFSQVRAKTLELLRAMKEIIGDRMIRVAISGSAGFGVANAASIPFVQEVYATGETVRLLESDTSAVIELGGEDAKIIFFDGGLDERMNGSCAGGTGAFIDQMATLLDLTNEEMDALSLKHERIYPIASRCGVFAKTDIQPLLNQGASKADIAASIYRAVVNQTLAGLAQGKKIGGKVMFLGGPLHYCLGLRQSFKEVLGLDSDHAIFPEYGRYAVAIGAALYAEKQSSAFSYIELDNALENAISQKSETQHLEPLFESEAAYDVFRQRHMRASVQTLSPQTYSGDAYLGIDCGSTTTKLVLISRDAKLLYTYYSSNRGNPVEIVKEQLEEIYRLCGKNIKICGSAVTGYGEELIKNAFHVDVGIVETIAHYTAAKFFNPCVDFILDIGGQDIKCFKIKNGAIDSIMLNEACSSGCGSFIETFAKSMGYEIEDFSRLGLFSKAPVDLGSRCTVFMNSSVKQAQKDGASVEDISAGLSTSVVKNAIYKVIRANSADELGNNIVVQGGTFLNDAVLRSFEKEIGHEVVRPRIAGVMGAFGAALIARSNACDASTLITADALKSFSHTSRSASCHGCGNNCQLTVNTFADGGRYISGNKCEKGALGDKAKAEPALNLCEYKRSLLSQLESKGYRGVIGLPMALGMYELAPLWSGIFSALGFGVVTSGFSSRELYSMGQYSIPSDTACYPAKLMHGHIEKLIEKKADAIFYPCLSYNIDEGISDNHYNCPVVAYYSELLSSNMDSLRGTKFIYPYLNINDRKELARELCRALEEHFTDISCKEVMAAVDVGFCIYEEYMAKIRAEGARTIALGRETGKRIMILAGRPYHCDPEISHGIDKLATKLGFAVVSEDALEIPLGEVPEVSVLNQWTYHARLYAAAEYASRHSDTELVQLVSFGCGIDAITTDEVRAILERNGKLYTQIKIDEITNLGAVNIRLRSLLGALEQAKYAEMALSATDDWELK